MARKGPGTDGPLQIALLESMSASTTRASEGQKIFSPIATFLNKYRSQTISLAPHLLRALTTLSDDLILVVQQHFNAYISNILTTSILPALSPSPSSSPTSNSLPPSLPPSHPPSGLEQLTYATITQYTPVKSTPTTHSKAPIKKPMPLTGFALCPSSPEALLAFEAQKEIISTFFVNCQIERSSQWVSYRVVNVPVTAQP
ncbi:conserved hypothetical protein [Talaromyces stipitatus ATCC 10500]|uniref:Uncharacterized protein n=1 Tax=Talaromyces stipitatus (strain ATCC 10500 / CBS 375.48 / QM 6759 / NRRL 1006) TaxID=441959 RepID=B8M2A3_TALSN|nr:uncharacterized protein TSTA_088030 [Talaromyces stipitatus ATCC 10500]EED21567.1 conserved hypothetical protein [Talaromyces stipitatus ATCC 10500]